MRIIYYIIVTAIVCCFSACEDMNSIHKEYLEGGEIIYAEKIDSVKVYPGINRVMLKVYIDTLGIHKITVKGGYNDAFETDFFDLKQYQDGTGSLELILDDVAEGDNVLNIYSFDRYDNISLPVETYVKSYGESYINGLISRFVKSQILISDVYSISFKIPIESDLLFTELEYTNATDGEIQKIKIMSDNDELVELPDFNVNETCRYRSLYTPDPEAIDSIYSEYITIESESWN